MAFRVAIIGTGHVAHLHANAYRASGKAEVVAYLATLNAKKGPGKK